MLTETEISRVNALKNTIEEQIKREKQDGATGRLPCTLGTVRWLIVRLKQTDAELKSIRESQRGTN